MPLKPVTIRRWEVVVSFVTVSLAFVIAAIILGHHQHQLNKLAHQNRYAIHQILKFRHDRAIVTLRADTELCIQNHRLVKILKEFLIVGTKEFQLRPVARDNLKAFQKKALKDIRMADCNPKNLPSQNFIPKP